MVYIIHKEASFCTLKDGNPLPIADALKAVDANRMLNPSYKLGAPPIYVNFFNHKTRRFPTGLLNTAIKSIRVFKKDADIQIVDKVTQRKKLEHVPADILNGKTLHPWQLEAVNKVIDNERGVILAGTGAGKCLSSNHLITMADGRVIPLKKVKVGDGVVAVNPVTLKMEEDVVTDVWDNGDKIVYEVKLNNHCVLELTGNHPLLTNTDKWTEVSQLKVGDLVAVPSEISFFGDFDMPDYKIKVLSYMLAEGGCSQSQLHFTNADEYIVNDFKSAVSCFKNSTVHGPSSDGMTYSLCRLRLGEINCWDVKQFILDCGLGGKLSKGKVIPDFVFKLPQEKMALFLRCFISCDGHLGKKGVEVGLASEIMVRQIRDLLLKFGVHGSMRHKKTNYDTDAWVFTSTGRKCLQNFVTKIGVFQKDQMVRAKEYLKDKSGVSYAHKDRLPITGYTLSRKYTEGVCRAKGIVRIKHNKNSYISRKKALEIVSKFDDSELQVLVEGQVWWREVVSIRKIGLRPTYDLTTKKYHNFIANNIICHNTIIMMAIIAELLSKGLKVMVVVPTTPILAKTVTSMEEHLEIKVGMYGGQRKSIEDVTVITNQSLAAYARNMGYKSETPFGTAKVKFSKDVELTKFIESADAIFVDEVHLSTAPAWYKACMMSKAWFRVGMSGTIDAESEVRVMRLQAATGEILVEKRACDLIEEGLLAKPYIHAIIDESIYGDYRSPAFPLIDDPIRYTRLLYEAAVVNNRKYNSSVIDLVEIMSGLGWAVLVVCQRRPHFTLLSNILQERDIDFFPCWGSTSLGARVEAMDTVERDGEGVILATKIFDLGIDIPALDAIVLTAGGKSPSSIKQRIGRGLRAKHGKANVVHIFDFMDNSHRKLAQHALFRWNVYEEEKFEIVPEDNYAQLLWNVENNSL